MHKMYSKDCQWLYKRENIQTDIMNVVPGDGAGVVYPDVS